MCPGDLSQPWFHKAAIRDDIESQLKAATQGTFVIRPSSQRACYAMSWSNGDGTVSHNLIYNQFPGYSLKLRPLKDEVFITLVDLVQQCSFLSDFLPNPLHEPEPSISQTSSEIIRRITTSLDENEPILNSLEWSLTIIEGSGFAKVQDCEWRTRICFSTEDHVAPVLFRLEDDIATHIFRCLARNSTVQLLKLTGHGGFMNYNFMPNIGDVEVSELCKALGHNSTLTALDLSNNNITDKGASDLSRLLAHNTCIKKLKLNSNFITLSGLVSLAQGLANNSTLEVFEIENQCVLKLNKVGLSTSVLQRSLSNLIFESMQRRHELINIPHEFGFQGFLTPEAAEARIFEFIHHTKPGVEQAEMAGFYFFYLNPNLTNRIVLCYSAVNRNGLGVFHKQIYRTPFGYSFTRSLHSEKANSYGIPTLVDHCLWTLACPPRYLPASTGCYNSGITIGDLSSDLQEKYAMSADLVGLWRIPYLAGESELEVLLSKRDDCYPTLLYLVQRNKFSLKHMVPKQRN